MTDCRTADNNMETFKKFSSGCIIMMILMVIPQSSCITVKQSLEEAFNKFKNFTEKESCIFPTAGNVGIEFPDNNFPLKACSSENELNKGQELSNDTDSIEYVSGRKLCFLFFDKSQELCHDDKLKPESLGKMTRKKDWNVCVSARAVLEENSFLTKYPDLCKSVCEGNKATAHVCRLLIAALVMHEEGITAEHSTEAHSSGTEDITEPTVTSSDTDNDKKKAEGGTATDESVKKEGTHASEDKDKDDLEKKSTPAPEDKGKDDSEKKSTPAPEDKNESEKEGTSAPEDKNKDDSVKEGTHAPEDKDDSKKESTPAPEDKGKDDSEKKSTPAPEDKNESEKEGTHAPEDKNKDDSEKESTTAPDGKENEEVKAVSMAVSDSSSFKFIVILIVIMVLILAAYALYHKREVIIAYIMERGESDKSSPSESPKSKVKYSKLKADEELPYLDRSITTRNYIY